MKLNCADLYVIHDTMYQALKVMNYSGMFPEDVRTETMHKVMGILAHIDIDITATEVELECNETENGA